MSKCIGKSCEDDKENQSKEDPRQYHNRIDSARIVSLQQSTQLCTHSIKLVLSLVHLLICFLKELCLLVQFSVDILCMHLKVLGNLIDLFQVFILLVNKCLMSLLLHFFD